MHCSDENGVKSQVMVDPLAHQQHGGGDDDEGGDETGNGEVHCLPPPGHVSLVLCRGAPVVKVDTPGTQPAQV